MAKRLAVVFGVILILVAVIGFIPNPVIGHENAFFLTNGLHNAVHFLIGVILLIASANGQKSSSLWLKLIGIVFLILSLVGFIQGGGLMLGLVSYNGADNYLNLVIGIVLLGAGIMLGKSHIDNATL